MLSKYLRDKTFIDLLSHTLQAENYFFFLRWNKSIKSGFEAN